MKVLVIASLAESLVIFRGQLLTEMIRCGHEVFACAAARDTLFGPKSEQTKQLLAQIGVVFYEFPLERTGLNPLSDIVSLAALWNLVRRLQPDVVLTYTMKPVVYGSLAASAARVPHIFSMITGIGTGMRDNDGHQPLLSRLVPLLYRLGLWNNAGVLFQNPDDRDLFIHLRLIRPQTAITVVNGSGIDLQFYRQKDPVLSPVVFLLIARLLGDKGVREYAEAARLIKRRYPDAVFRLIGPFDNHPLAIPKQEVVQWQHDGIIEYIGSVTDVRPYIAAASVYVLPSYREGTPRTVLEAMAMSRPIITTNAPGCRETVVSEENGFLVPTKDPIALSQAMERFILDPGLIPQMGRKSRQIAEEKYDVHKVNAAILQAMGLLAPDEHNSEDSRA